MDYKVQCIYIQDNSKITGTASVDKRFYLKDSNGSVLTDTLISFEHIESMRIRRRYLEIKVYPSMVKSYKAFIYARQKSFLKKLAKEIAEKAGMRKRFLLYEWKGDVYLS